jgi:hypothetical protein
MGHLWIQYNKKYTCAPGGKRGRSRSLCLVSIERGFAPRRHVDKGIVVRVGLRVWDQRRPKRPRPEPTLLTTPVPSAKPMALISTSHVRVRTIPPDRFCEMFLRRVLAFSRELSLRSKSKHAGCVGAGKRTIRGASSSTLAGRLGGRSQGAKGQHTPGVNHEGAYPHARLRVYRPLRFRE